MKQLYIILFQFILILQFTNGFESLYRCKNETSGCVGANVRCADGSNCLVYCGLDTLGRDSYGCQDTTIWCPENYNCTVICSGYYACENLEIRATTSHFLSIRDCESGTNTCKGLVIYCPENYPGNGITTCNLFSGDNGLYQIIVHSLLGFKSFSYKHNGDKPSMGLMYCGYFEDGYEYPYECRIDNTGSGSLGLPGKCLNETGGDLITDTRCNDPPLTYEYCTSSVGNCQRTTIDCKEGQDCFINCGKDENDEGACGETVINCPMGKNCVIDCTGTLACVELEVNAENSQQLIISDCVTGSNTCPGMKLKCPSYFNGNPNCILASGDNGQFDLQIYSRLGFRTFFNGNFGDRFEMGTMNCGLDYDRNCLISNSERGCLGSSDDLFCSAPQLTLISCTQSNQICNVNGPFNGTIECFEGQDCFVTCGTGSDREACLQMYLKCPKKKKCEITCSGSRACKDTIIDARESDNLIINDCKSGSNTCQGLIILCPTTNINDGPSCIIEGDNGLFDIAVYNVYGFKTFSYIDFSGTHSSMGDMYCGETYDHTCRIDNASPKTPQCYKFGGIDTTCNDPPTLNPTKAPTPKPTLTPTQKPTNAPTMTPSDFPSFPPTKRPTFVPTPDTPNPTTRPTPLPTPEPSIRPTYEPTNRPTYRPSNEPTDEPSITPTIMPSYEPSNIPTNTYIERNTTNNPSMAPTMNPTNETTSIGSGQNFPDFNGKPNVVIKRFPIWLMILIILLVCIFGIIMGCIVRYIKNKLNKNNEIQHNRLPKPPNKKRIKRRSSKNKSIKDTNDENKKLFNANSNITTQYDTELSDNEMDKHDIKKSMNNTFLSQNAMSNKIMNDISSEMTAESFDSPLKGHRFVNQYRQKYHDSTVNMNSILSSYQNNRIIMTDDDSDRAP